MKGNPLLLLILVLAFLGVVAWPVCELTLRPASSSCPVPLNKEPVASATLRGNLLFRAAPSPIRCSVSQHGIILLTESNLTTPGEYRAAVEIDAGDDLIITAEWGKYEPHAVRVEIQIQGWQEPLARSFWANRSLEDTFPIPDSLNQ